MSIISLSDMYLSYSAAPLFDHTDFSVDTRERVAIVGRNGAGKSTLLKIIEGLVKIDDGKRIVKQDLKISRLEQDPPAHLDTPVYCYVATGVPNVGELLSEYFLLINDNNEHSERISELTQKIEVLGGWKFDTEIKRVISLMQLDANQNMSLLSGGWLRKVALARSLVSNPDLLLLDEPTNHVDIPTIEWLQKFINDFSGAVVFISHDRSFINAIATRVVDVDRGKISSFPGNFEAYINAKKEALRLEELDNQDFDRRLSIEEAWIRKGIKARLTRSDSRVRHLKEMRRERQERRNRLGNVSMKIDDNEQSGKIVLEVENLTLKFKDRTLINDFSGVVTRGDRIGIVGANGTGKTSFIKMVLGELEPSSGKLKLGSRIQIAYFDQYREQLDPEKSVMDNLALGKTEVEVGGKKKHVYSYLQDFLFSPERARTPVKALSGGEKNRLLLARIFLRPCNLLILDEPTNDLDIETLDLLEEILEKFQATLIVVSHDRYFLDRVVTDVWYFDGSGKIETFIGGYSDCRSVLDAREKATVIEAPKKEVPPIAKKTELTPKVRRLSYKENKELEAMPKLIEDLENEIQELDALFCSADYAKSSPEEQKKSNERYSSCLQELEKAYARWEELEAISNLKGKSN